MPEDQTITTDEVLRLRHGSAADRSRLAALAVGDARLAAEMEEWDRQDAALRALYAPVAEEPLPDRLTRAVRDARTAPVRRAVPAWGRIAAAVGLIGLGVLIGLGTARLLPTDVPPTLARAAMASYATYAVEVRHPVEVAASDEAHLVQWLSKRLGAPIRVPDLGGEGFTLIGGRLLPGETTPAALLMYEDGVGRRLALYITRSEGAGQDLAFADAKGSQAFWWIEDGLGCAVAGDLPRETLRKLAVAAYHGLTET